VQFLLPAHITGLAVGMLLYAPQSLGVFVFASFVAIASKYVVRVAVARDAHGRPVLRHVLNPSNFGIALTVLLLPNSGVAAPYQFSENTSGTMDWMIPAVVMLLGSILNTLFTQRIVLVCAWLAAFAIQALARALVHGTPLLAGLMPMTGFAFLLFTFYMVTDPATTPSRPARQAIFAVTVAAAYGVLMELHVVFTLFFALALVTAGRGVMMALRVPVRPGASARTGARPPDALVAVGMPRRGGLAP
jgi:hypothetical protein